MFDRNEQEISQIIAEGLEAILSGQATLEQVLAAHPRQAASVQPSLEAGLWLGSQRAQIDPRPGFVMASRRRLVQRINEESSAQGAKHAIFGLSWPRQWVFQWAIALSLFVILCLRVGTIVSLSQTALPGDDLYQVKRAYEQVVITVVPDQSQRAALFVQFSKRRLDEARVLIDKGDYKAAESTLKELEQGIKDTLTTFQSVSNNRQTEKHELAVQLKQNLTNIVDQLSTLANTAPSDIQGVVVRAHDVSMQGVVATNRVIIETEKKTLPTRSIPTAQVKQTATPVPVNTATVPARTDNPAGPFIPPTQVNNQVPTTGSSASASQQPVAPVTTVEPTSTPPATMTASPTAIPTSTETPTPVFTDTPVPVDTATQVPTPTETPTDLPSATETPTVVSWPTEPITTQNTPAPSGGNQPGVGAGLGLLQATQPTETPTVSPLDVTITPTAASSISAY